MTILVIAPHADDEVLGVGGTIARYVSEGKRVVVAVITGHGETEHPLWPRELWDSVRKECRDSCDTLGVDKLIFRELPAACLDSLPAWEVNSVIADLLKEVGPDEVFIPFQHDLHKDHEVISYACTVALRAYLPLGKQVKRILAYETLSETNLSPSYLSPSFQPNVYIDISQFLDAKLEAMSAYKTQLQLSEQPRSPQSLSSLAQLRGAHIGVKAAEAFLLIREAL